MCKELQGEIRQSLNTKNKFKNVIENEECSDKLRDTILFQSHNNLVLTTFINKIINDNLLEGLITEGKHYFSFLYCFKAGKELTKMSQITKNLESKFVNKNIITFIN